MLGLELKDLGGLNGFPFTALGLVMRLDVLQFLTEAVLKALNLFL